MNFEKYARYDCICVCGSNTAAAFYFGVGRESVCIELRKAIGETVTAGHAAEQVVVAFVDARSQTCAACILVVPSIVKASHAGSLHSAAALDFDSARVLVAAAAVMSVLGMRISWSSPWREFTLMLMSS